MEIGLTKLPYYFKKYVIGGNYPSLIIELGARDCTETLDMNDIFSHPKIFSFECNPDTISICKQKIEGKENILLIQKAVADHDGEITFFQIDKENTQTTWKDGNPGASSLFKASANYEVEKYKQKEVTVPCIKLESFLEEQSISFVDLLWMDIQGAELMALKSLGDKIKNIKLIHTEAEFFEIYDGQPLFKDLKTFLNLQEFKCVGQTTHGEYAADFVFVNKKYLNKNKCISAFLRDTYYGLKTIKTFKKMLRFIFILKKKLPIGK